MNIFLIFVGIGDWGLGIGPNPQSPIPNPQNIYLALTFYINIIYNMIIVSSC